MTTFCKCVVGQCFHWGELRVSIRCQHVWWGWLDSLVFSHHIRLQPFRRVYNQKVFSYFDSFLSFSFGIISHQVGKTWSVQEVIIISQVIGVPVLNPPRLRKWYIQVKNKYLQAMNRNLQIWWNREWTIILCWARALVTVMRCLRIINTHEMHDSLCHAAFLLIVWWTYSWWSFPSASLPSLS